MRRASLLVTLAILLTIPLSTGDGARSEVSWNETASFTMASWIDPDHPLYARNDGSGYTSSTNWDPYFDLDPDSRRAVSRCPEWTNHTLTLTLLRLERTVRDMYSSILNDPSVASNLMDEIAFSVANTPVEILSDPRVDPYLFRENAETMYDIDTDLDYVSIVDSVLSDGEHSTVEYRMESGNRTVPEWIYYRYVVHPRNTLELPSYIDRGSWSYGDRDTGDFWRTYLYDVADPDYPVLSDYLANQTVLWKGKRDDLIDNGAMGAIARWQRECVPTFGVDPMGNRSHQPVLIYDNHWGMCGENSDLLTAACKIGLIPSVQVLNLIMWHGWNQFYEDGWHMVRAYDGVIDNPDSEGMPGSVPAFAAIDPEGMEFDATPLYTFTSNLTVNVVDLQGNPVDGALVNLATEDAYNYIDGIGFIGNATDTGGSASFKIGFGFDFYVNVRSDMGQYPQGGGLSLALPMASPFQEYEFNVTLPGKVLPGMADPLYPRNRDFGTRFTVSASEIEQHTTFQEIPMQQALSPMREGGDILRMAFLDDENLDLYLAGEPFTPGMLVNVTLGNDTVVILPADRSWHPVIMGELQPNTVSRAVLNVTVSDSSVIPFATIGSPLTGPYFTTEPILFMAILDAEVVGGYELLWDLNGDDISSEREFSMYLEEGIHSIGLSVIEGERTVSRDRVIIEVNEPNMPPVANISSPRSGSVFELGTAIHFSSGGTVDPNGDTLEYIWFLLPMREVLSLSDDFSARLGLGEHTIELNVSDGRGGYDIDTVRVTIVPVNHRPAAYISSPPDSARYEEGDTVLLSANGTSDLDGDVLTFTWSSDIDGTLSGEREDAVTLSPGEHTIELSVSDGRLSDTRSVRVRVDQREPPADLPPVAVMSKPWEGAVYNISDTIVLDSTGSHDPEGGAITVEWYVNDELVSTEMVHAIELPRGVHTVTLLVRDANLSASIVRSIAVIDRSPVVLLLVNGTEFSGEQIVCPVNGTMTFDLSGSSDPDGTELSYSWTVDGALVSNGSVLVTKFSLGPHIVRFVVGDSTGMSHVGEFRVRAYLHETHAPDPEPEETDDGIPLMTVLLPAAAIILLAMVAIGFFLMRSRTGSEE